MDSIFSVNIVENPLSEIWSLLQYDATRPMIFSSGVFFVLFVAFFAIYSLIKGHSKARILYVIGFSLYFYYKSSGIYLLLLLAVSVSDFLLGEAIWRAKTQRRKRIFLASSIIINLSLLGYFKYTNLLVEFAQNLFGSGFLEFQNIFLPVGISFFLFQSMSYTIDIYRAKIAPLRDWTHYIFYLSFFPQLVAGPIVRAKDFIWQILSPHALTRSMWGTALFLILVGLVKKAVISDYISLNFVDRVFDEPLLYSGFENLMAIYGYALQIFCDFSGYSDMAIGLALLMGFRFPDNFNSPYKSATITEFWRRWHISLSSWLRDYLYISLGGNRHGKLRTYLNLLLTMLLGGLWHGAAVRFILWGALHGAALALHKAWMSIFPRAKAEGSQMGIASRVVGVIFTFNLVCLGWLLFRAEDMNAVSVMLNQITDNFNAQIIPQVLTGYAPAFALMAFGFIFHFMPSIFNSWAKERFNSTPLWGQMLLAVLVIWIVMQASSSEIQPFIYFQF